MCKKQEKEKKRKNPSYNDGHFSWKEKMFCLAIFLSIFYIPNQFVAILIKI
jgi:hypothetical protein